VSLHDHDSLRGERWWDEQEQEGGRTATTPLAVPGRAWARQRLPQSIGEGRRRAACSPGTSGGGGKLTDEVQVAGRRQGEFDWPLKRASLDPGRPSGQSGLGLWEDNKV
jgi:hypothetical protein